MSEQRSMSELMGAVKRDRDLVRAQVDHLVAMKTVAYRFPATTAASSPGTFIVHRDPAREDSWRVTKLDMTGVPTGHVESSSKKLALQLADELGAGLFVEQYDVMARSEAQAIGLVPGASASPAPTGAKHDAGKERYDLIPPGVLCDLARVLTHGAQVYAPENWRKVPNPEARYYAAAMRHLEAWRMGLKVDPDSQLPHLAHALCCITFLAAFSSGEARAVPPASPAVESEDEIAYVTGPRPVR